MIKGLKDGYGELFDFYENFSYKGTWVENLKSGEGVLHYLEEGFLYEGKFLKD